MKKLTPRQQEVLSAIEGFWKEHGYGPTFRELGAVLGINSVNGVATHIRMMARKGVVTYEPGKSRTLRVKKG